MKSRSIVALLCALAMLVSLAACGGDSGKKADDGTTAAEGTTVADVTTVEETTEAATEAPTEAVTEPETEPETEAPAITVVDIASADDLVAFAAAVTDGSSDYSGATVNINADIDLSAVSWVPMVIDGCDGIIFEGNNHTISGMTVAGAEGQIQLGFIGYCTSDITVRNLTFKDAAITATGKHAGCVIGELGAEATIDKVTVDTFTVAGGIGDWGSTDLICFRIGGIIGMANADSVANVTDCTVNNINLTGFHNLAALIGSDQVCVGDVSNNKVSNIILNFSAGYSDNYDAAKARQFVDVFYNDAEWSNHADYDAGEGNTFENVTSHDIAYDVDYSGNEGKA